MKTLLLSIIVLIGFCFTSCTSEYEERLEEGKKLILRLDFLKESQSQLSDELIKDELTTINNEITVLAKLSGNEELFLVQLKNL